MNLYGKSCLFATIAPDLVKDDCMSLKTLRKNLRKRLLRRLFGWQFMQQILNDHQTVSRLGNLAYLQHYPDLLTDDYLPDFNTHEFSCYSQNGEDGLILHLLSRIGVASHYIIEVGIEDGRECNSANLILNYGWQGCLVEASPEWAEKAAEYMAETGASKRVALLNLLATPDNLQERLRQAGVPDEVDVLSIDIDSYDYWLWSSIVLFAPRLVVIEYNASFGPVRSVTVPYSVDWKHVSRYYHGASITALERLGREKGYVLVGCDSKGVNAFFVREDLADKNGISAVTPDQAYRPHFRRTQKRSVEEQMKAVEGMPVQQIGE